MIAKYTGITETLKYVAVYIILGAGLIVNGAVYHLSPPAPKSLRCEYE